MKCLITFLLLHCICLRSFGTELSSILRKLDSEIQQRDYYLARKDSSLQRLKQELCRCDTDSTHRLLLLNHRIFQAYQSFQYDSAYVFAMRTLKLAEQQKDPDWILKAKGDILFCFFSGGAFKEAADWVEDTSVGAADSLSRGEYYALCTRLYSDMCSYARIPGYQKKYLQLMTAYRDSVLCLLPDTSYTLREVRTLYETGVGYEEKRKAYQQLLAYTQNIHQKAVITSRLAHLYLQQRDTLEAVRQWVTSSIYDLQDGVMETTSKTDLASCLYTMGYLKEASRYVHLALEEANFYNATHRILTINSILPIIEKAHLGVITRQRDNLKSSLWLVSLLSAGAIFAFWMVCRQKSKLKKAGNAIDAQRRLLSELHEIKDVYILQAIRAKSDYLEKTEDILRKVDYRIKSKQYTELNRLAAEFNLKEERKSFFQTFDQAFLMLFPDFISEYNCLFEEKDRVQTEEKSKALTPELRIFALIRLGITDNEEIARFLNLSVNTIYAYKTKVKGKSRVPKEEFEDYIARIPKKSTEINLYF